MSNFESCVDACREARNACYKTAEQAKGESGMERLIGLCDECVSACQTCMDAMTAGSNAEALRCAHICDQCADECEEHDRADARECLDACRRCAEHCREAASAAA